VALNDSAAALSAELPTGPIDWRTRRPCRRRRRPGRCTSSVVGVEGRPGQAASPVDVTSATTDREVALRWFDQFEGAGLDGIVAKPLDGAYEPDKRVMFKIKDVRTVDCVVAGYRCTSPARTGLARSCWACATTRARSPRSG